MQSTNVFFSARRRPFEVFPHELQLSARMPGVLPGIVCQFGICTCDSESSCNTMVGQWCTGDDFVPTGTPNPKNGAATAGNCTGKPPKP